jgi:hypothetical protein
MPLKDATIRMRLEGIPAAKSDAEAFARDLKRIITVQIPRAERVLSDAQAGGKPELVAAAEQKLERLRAERNNRLLLNDITTAKEAAEGQSQIQQAAIGRRMQLEAAAEAKSAAAVKKGMEDSYKEEMAVTRDEYRAYEVNDRLEARRAKAKENTAKVEAKRIQDVNRAEYMAYAEEEGRYTARDKRVNAWVAKQTKLEQDKVKAEFQAYDEEARRSGRGSGGGGVGSGAGDSVMNFGKLPGGRATRMTARLLAADVAGMISPEAGGAAGMATMASMFGATAPVALAVGAVAGAAMILHSAYKGAVEAARELLKLNHEVYEVEKRISKEMEPQAPNTGIGQRAAGAEETARDMADKLRLEVEKNREEHSHPAWMDEALKSVSPAIGLAGAMDPGFATRLLDNIEHPGNVIRWAVGATTDEDVQKRTREEQNRFEIMEEVFAEEKKEQQIEEAKRLHINHGLTVDILKVEGMREGVFKRIALLTAEQAAAMAKAVQTEQDDKQWGVHQEEVRAEFSQRTINLAHETERAFADKKATEQELQWDMEASRKAAEARAGLRGYAREDMDMKHRQAAELFKFKKDHPTESTEELVQKHRAEEVDVGNLRAQQDMEIRQDRQMELDILLGTKHPIDAIVQKEERRLALQGKSVDERKKELDDFRWLAQNQAIARTPREQFRQGWDAIKDNPAATAMDKALWLQSHLSKDDIGRFTDARSWLRDIQSGAVQPEKLGEMTLKEVQLMRKIMEQLLKEAEKEKPLIAG